MNINELMLSSKYSMNVHVISNKLIYFIIITIDLQYVAFICLFCACINSNMLNAGQIIKDE